MKIGVGSKNPAKISAVAMAAGKEIGEIIVMDSPSGVSAMPFSDEETMQGAIQRAKHCFEHTESEAAVGLEGGVVQTDKGLFLCNWGALVTEDKEPIVAGGARILLPQEIAERLYAGEELGPVMDDFTKSRNIRHNEGAIGVFTDGLVSRKDMFEHICKMLFGQLTYSKKRSTHTE